MKNSLVLVSLLLLAAGLQPVRANGIRIVHLPSVAPAPPGIAVDGKLDEWQGVAGYVFSPLAVEGLAAAPGDPAVAAMVLKQPSVNMKTCYDTDALYVALEWTDSAAGTNAASPDDANRWSEGGEGVELHLETDRTLHLACWPAAGGRTLAVRGRYDNEGEWHDASSQFTAVGGRGADASHYVVEIRLPWSAVTRDGKMPADGTLRLGADLGWNAIDAAMVESLRKVAAAANGEFLGVPFCFLSSHVPQLGFGPLMNTFEWGQLALGDAAGKDQAVITPEETSLKRMPVSTGQSAPAMDGTLSGWDPDSFQTAALLPAFFGDRFKCRLATQYDAKNLYVAAHFLSSGHFSNIKTENSQAGYNGGDALQIRLNNGSSTVNLCGWFDTRSGKPALTVDGREMANPYLLTQGAAEQFKMDADGKGYVQEITLPWSVLFRSAPAAGQTLKGTFQLWFADLTPRFSFFSKTNLERRGAIPVAYKMPASGQLTLGLFDKSGRLLKWLTQDDYRPAGDNREFWDGLDQWGRPVAAGNYDLKALYHPPLSLEYLMTVCNPGNPPWPTPDDKGDWLSDEASPQAVATDGRWVFLASPGSEKGYAVIGLDENGQRQWGLKESFNPRSVSLAVAGDNLYVLFSGPEITDDYFMYSPARKNAIGRAVLLCLDKKTGKPVKFTREVSHLQVATWPYRDEMCWLWDLRNNKSFSPFNYGGQPRYSNLDIGDTTDALGMTVIAGKVYVSMPYENKLLVLDAETGKPGGSDIPVNSPAGLCALNDHALLAVSGTKVVQVDLTTREVTPFIGDGLVAPDSIALDRSGKVYVSDWGSSFQVKTFDRDARFLRAIGTPGGRPWVGKWDPNGMLVPRGVAVTDEGKLWVMEDDGSPKRISVWDTSSGAFVKDYIGPTPYGGGMVFWIDPKDSTEVHAEGTRFKVDYAKKTYTPEAIDYRKAGMDSPFTPNGHNLDRFQPRVLYRDGHEYVFTGIDWKGVSILQRKGDTYQPVAAIGGFPYDGPAELHPDSDANRNWDSDIKNHLYPHYFPGFFAGHMGYNYAWTDDNGDNVVQPQEMRWLKTAGGNPDYQPGLQKPWDHAWCFDISPEFGIYFIERFRDKTVIFRLDPKGWTTEGAPIYDMADAKAVITKPHNMSVDAIHVTLDKKIIVAYGYEGADPNKVPDSIEAFDLEGKSLWSIAMPRRQEGKNVHANYIGYDFNVPGLGDVVCTWLYHGSEKAFYFTTDGLYVASPLDETLLGPAAIWSESARSFYQTPAGVPFIINGANQQENILRVHGLENGGRMTGSLSISQEDFDTAAALRNVPEAKAPPKPIIRLAWLTTPPKIDGDLSDWNMDKGVGMDGGKGRTADVALGRDKENLYLAYRVHETTPPLTNGGGDLRDLYVSGDCVDLMLGNDPKADPHRHDAVPGDERLLFSVFQGQPVAVLYRPVVPGTTAPIRLGSAQVDQIIRLDSARVAVRRDAGQGTYTVEASVPLKDLSIDPGQKDTLRGDVGVIFADESGRSRAQRLYYYNKDTSMVADIPTETRLQPSEWGAIELPLGPNLLQNGGFEENFVDSASRADHGWFVTDQSNGSDVVVTTDLSHSGHRSLLMETPVPVTFPSAAYDFPDYGDFIRSANNGKGRSHAEIMQRVPVIGGHRYSVRFCYRNEDFQGERKETGHPRGYINFGGRIDWSCKPPDHGYLEGVGETKDAHFAWQELVDQRRDLDLPQPFTAPRSATAATLYFELTTLAENHRPKVFLDDVEFVDITPSSP